MTRSPSCARGCCGVGGEGGARAGEPPSRACPERKEVAQAAAWLGRLKNNGSECPHFANRGQRYELIQKDLAAGQNL